MEGTFREQTGAIFLTPREHHHRVEFSNLSHRLYEASQVWQQQVYVVRVIEQIEKHISS